MDGEINSGSSLKNEGEETGILQPELETKNIEVRHHHNHGTIDRTY
jgi:hypothetical protein